MKRWKRRLVVLGAGALSLWMLVVANATMVTLDVTNITTGNFSSSDLHDAANYLGTFGGANYYASGTVLAGGMSGVLTANLTTSGTVTSYANITGTVTASNGVVLNITGGSISDDSSKTPYASGTLDITISQGSYSRTEVFTFAPFMFSSSSTGPNTLTTGGFALWGNNWLNAPVSGCTPVGSRACGDGNAPAIGNQGTLQSNRLGMDFTATVVPLPAGLPLLFSGLSALGLMVRRRPLAAADDDERTDRAAGPEELARSWRWTPSAW